MQVLNPPYSDRRSVRRLCHHLLRTRHFIRCDTDQRPMFGMQSSLILLNIFRPNLVQIPEALDLCQKGSWDSTQRMEDDCVKDPTQERNDWQCHQKPGTWKAETQQHRAVVKNGTGYIKCLKKGSRIGVDIVRDFILFWNPGN
jgi:hypothetical protein